MALAIFFFFGTLSGYAETEPFKLKAEAVPGEIQPGRESVIMVTFTFPPDHYLYADKTNVTPAPVPGLTFGNIKKPESIKKQDPYLGMVSMYKEATTIQLPVQAEESAAQGSKNITLTVDYQGCKNNLCFMPQSKEMRVELVIASADSAIPAGTVQKPVIVDSLHIADSALPDTPVQEFKPFQSAQKIEKTQPLEKEQNPFRKTAEKFGLIGVLGAAFLWGLLASLTPCVYPMIPVTVSVIGAGSSGSVFRGFILSIFYVIGLSLTYAIFGTVAAWSGSLFGEYTNHPATRIIVAGIFVILALGMFDVFYLQMPSAISSKLGGSKGTGVAGVFMTGAAAGAVVGPCVGPMLVGLLVYIAALGSKLQGFLIMWSFALGMGVLFLVIGTFSGAAASLPKAGEWMNRIKHMFGILLIGMALYYVKPLIEANAFTLMIGGFFIWAGVFIGALDPFSSEPTGWNRFWKTAGIVCLALGIGYVAKFTLGSFTTPQQSQVIRKSSITWLSDEESALAQAKKQNKPLMIDFSADWCAACIKLDRETFSSPDVTEAAKRFVSVKIDCTDNKDPVIKHLRKKYKVVGLPTIVFVSRSGHILQDMTITEYVRPKVLLEWMSKVV
ncbi:MAG: protein-disulfide reductase DsbD [Desulfobacteraceae bacterium]|nr:protein-disulfide reductase DsbD [Desulfobacteraceae bacterium]